MRKLNTRIEDDWIHKYCNLWNCYAIIDESILFHIDNWARLRWWIYTSFDYWRTERKTKVFQIFFRTRDALIDTIVAQIFEDDEAATPPPSPPPLIKLDPITSDPKRVVTRYKTIFTIILKKKNLHHFLHLYLTKFYYSNAPKEMPDS